MKHIVIAAVALTATATPAVSQTYLDQLLSRIGKKKGATSPTTGVATGQFSASITPAQTAVIDRLLAQPIQDPAVAAARTEAGPLIRTVLSIGSCARVSNAWNAANRVHMTPQTWDAPFGNERVAMANLKYHDKARCLDVARLADWTKPAANALKFRAYYIAEDSGEAKQQSFELQKASEGQWMIREIGVGLQ